MATHACTLMHRPGQPVGVRSANPAVAQQLVRTVCGVQQTFTGNEAATCTSSACYAEIEFVINSRSNSPLAVGNAVYVALTTNQFQARRLCVCHQQPRPDCLSLLAACTSQSSAAHALMAALQG